jgi:hypothetical protein
LNGIEALASGTGDEMAPPIVYERSKHSHGYKRPG